MLLAVEGGGTKTRVLLADAAGKIIAREHGGPASPLYIDHERYAIEIRELLQRIKDIAAEHGDRVALAGIAGPMDRELVERLLTEAFGPIKIGAAGESEIVLAFHDLAWGVSLIAGTGASCRALTNDGHAASCGGLGPQFGDEGSGYWIGRSAISAALRARDGRGPATSLTEKVCAAFGMEYTWDIFKRVDRSGHVSGTQIASLTPVVFAAAREGDAVANEICRDAGHELGRLVLATVRNLAWDSGPVPLVFSGGVFHGAELITIPLTEVLKESPIQFNVFSAVTEPTEGIIKWMRR